MHGANHSEPDFTLRILGSFDCRIGGQPLRPLRSRRGEWLLTLLALRHGREVERSWLADLLWPDSGNNLDNLRRTLTDLRDALGSQEFRLQSPTSHTLLLDLTGNAFADIVSFDNASSSRSPARLEEAVDLYRGSLMEGCSEEWIYLERENRAQIYLHLLETLASYAIQGQCPLIAVGYLRRILVADPLQEEVYRRLMALLAECGDYAAMNQVYHDLRRILYREMSLEPDPKTTALYQKLKAENKRKQAALLALSHTRSVPSRSGSFPTSPAFVPNNLPSYLTDFIGRSQEKQEVHDLLERYRLVTLTGTGGIGKTRLAVAVAADARSQFPQGVRFVNLASFTDSGRVVSAIAEALGVKEQKNRSLETDLIQTLSSQRILLVLDNCEHLATECARLSESLLLNCPSLYLLATSRTTLNVQGGITWRVPSLSLPERALPDDEVKDNADALLESDSVRLFVERVTRLLTTFKPTRRNLQTIAQICLRLDGIALGIELAAARVQGLSLEQILARLDDVFRLLTRGNEGALPRQRTLAAALDWSYRLLSPAEQVLFARLSVFSGGFRLEAAQSVCADTDPGDDTSSSVVRDLPVEDLLLQLMDKSLIDYESAAEGEGRFRMLETVRQYGTKLLWEMGEGPIRRGQHRDFFLSLVESAEPHLKGEEQGTWLERLESEHDNLSAALAWCEEEGEAGVEIGLRLGSALWRFWEVRGHFLEGRRLLMPFLVRSADIPYPEERAKALHVAGSLALSQGDYDAARPHLEESLSLYRGFGNSDGVTSVLNSLGGLSYLLSNYTEAGAYYEECLRFYRESGSREGMATELYNLANIATARSDYIAAKAYLEESLSIYREIGHTHGIALTLENLGLVAEAQGDDRHALRFHEESLSLRREIGDKWGIANAFNCLGRIAVLRGDWAMARSHFTESLSILREVADKRTIASVLNNLGYIAQCQADYIAARTYYEESLSLRKEIADRSGVANSLHNLGSVAQEQGDYAAARNYYAESLSLRKELGNRLSIAVALGAFAALAAQEQAPERSVCLWSAVERLRDEIASAMTPVEREEYDRTLTLARQSLEASAYAMAWSKGQSLTLEQAIDFALMPSS